MKCYLVQLRNGGAEIFVQYRDEWTQENADGQVRRVPGRIPAHSLSGMREIACSEVQAMLGREVEWLRQPPPEPIVRAIGREAVALVVALAIWAGLSLPIVAFAWQITSIWWFILLPLYLPAPVAAFVYTLLVHPRTRDNRVKRAIFLAALGWVLPNPIPGNPLFDVISKAFFSLHPIPAEWEGAMGVYVGLFLSFWVIGIPYCGYSGYWTGRLADIVLNRRSRRQHDPAAAA